MDRKECYRLTHPLSKISGYTTGKEYRGRSLQCSGVACVVCRWPCSGAGVPGDGGRALRRERDGRQKRVDALSKSRRAARQRHLVPERTRPRPYVATRTYTVRRHAYSCTRIPNAHSACRGGSRGVTRLTSHPRPWRCSLFHVIIMRVTYCEVIF